ncbi:hypothetical protein JCM10213v2_008647 [Rhodosporidiobolus nylandii]
MSPPPAPLGQESAPRPSSASSASALALAMGPEDVAADLARGGALAYDAGVQRRRESVDQGDDSDRESLASFSVSRPSSRPPSRPGSANGAYGAYGSYGIASARRERSSSQAETFASTSASASGFAPSPSPLPSLLLPHHPSQEPLFVRPSSAPPPPPSAAPAPTYAHGTERETPFSSLAGPAPRSSPALASPPLIHSAPNPHHTAIPMPTPLPQPLLNPPLTPLTPRQRQYTLHRGSNRFPLSGLLLTSADNPLPFLLSLATALVLPGLWWAFNGPFLWKHLGGGGKASLFVFAYLVLIMWASMLKTALTDPGILPRDLDPNPARKFVPAAEIEEGAGGRGGGAGGAEGEWRAEGKYLRVGGGGGGREGGGVVVSKWCETCRIYRPPRTSHCRLCDNCVEGTDHHCAFLNNCIGRLNYLPFLSFLLSAVLCSIYSIVFSAWHIYRTTTLPHPPSNPSSSSIQWNWETIGALVVAILAFGLLVPVGGLAAYHARLVWSNRTTVEMYEHLSLSLSLVVLPPVLDEALHFASSLSNLSAVDVADLALNTMLQLVRQRAGEGSFIGCWPAGVSTGMETKSLPDGVVKHRMMLFFRDVVAYQFRLAKSAYAPTLSAVFLRVLLPLVPLSLSPSISLPAFRQATLDSIAAEAARSRFAAATVDKTAVAKLLEYASREKRRVLHIVTAAGGDPLVFGVLRELVHYVSTISASPYSSTNPHIHATSHALEVEWASRPNLLHLTLAESRPLCLGAVLASRLYDVLLSSRTRATQLRQLASSYDNPYVHHPLSPGTTSRKLPSGLKKRVLAGRGFAWTKDDPQRPQPDERVEETAETYGTLDRLLKKAEVGVHAFPPPPAGLGAAKVRIEVAPDNALASAMKESKGGRGDLVVLIGAEAVLPGWGGDVMAAMGSWSLAQLAKMLGAKVYAVAASDLILPSSGSPPSSAQHDPSELYSGWATTLAAELEELDPFALSLAAGNEPDARVWTKASEVVPGGLIDGYITEKGVLSVGGCVQLAKERGVAEATLYGDR